MADENIQIQVDDKVAPSISTKLQGIANDARSANDAINKLQTALNQLSASSPLQKLQSDIAKLNNEMLQSQVAANKLATSNAAAQAAQEKLATSVQKTQAAMANTETAINRAVAAEAKAEVASLQLAAAKDKLAASQAKADAATAAGAETDAQAAARIQAMVAASLEAQAANSALAQSETSLAERQGARVAITEAESKAIADCIAAQTRQMVSTEEYIGVTVAETAAVEANTAAQVENAAAMGLNSRATAELGTLLGELASGNIGRLRQSSAALANQTGLLSKAFTLTGLSVIALGAALAAVIVWAIEGYNEFQQLNSAVVITGTASGVTAQGLMNMGAQMATVNVNAARMTTLLGALVATGRTTADTLGTVGNAARNMLTLTGESVDQVAQSFDKLYSDPIKWADDMDTKFHFLTADVRDHAAQLEAVGDKYGAAKVIAAAFADNTKAKVDSLNQSMGLLAQLLQRWQNGAATIKASIMDIGVPASTTQSFVDAKTKYNDWYNAVQSHKIDLADPANNEVLAYGNKLWQDMADKQQVVLNQQAGQKLAAAQDENRQALLAAGKEIDSVNDKTQKQVTLANKLAALKSAYQQYNVQGYDPVGDPTAASRMKGVSFDAQGNPQGGAYASKVAELQKEASRGDDKSGEKRGASLAAVNLQLDNQIALLGKLGPEREVQQKYDQIEQDLSKKKITLTDQESASIKSKLEQIQQNNLVQSQMNTIYEQATQPAKDYAATLQAANILLKDGVITQDQFTGTVRAAAETYKAALDPLYQMNKDLDEQMQLLQMLPQQRQIEQQIIQAENEALQKKHVMSQQEISDLRDRLTLQQQLNNVAQQEATLLNNSVQKRQGQTDTVTAIGKLQNNKQSGFTQGDAAGVTSNVISGMGLDTSNLQVQNEANVASYQTMYQQIDQLRQADLIKDQDAAALRAQVFNKSQTTMLSGASTFFGNLATMQSSQNKKAAAVGKAAAIAQATINTYQSATGAYASLASIPYVGPFLGAAAAAAAIVAGLANIAKIRSAPSGTGYMSGGYTGNIARDEVAGAVHGREYVFDAAATQRIGVDNLDALRRGANAVNQNSPQAGTVSQVNSNGGTAPGTMPNQRPNFTQNVSLVVSGKPDRRTPQQMARSLRRETVKELK